MRVGIIGGGFGLSVQAPIIMSHPKMELVAVCTMKRHVLPNELVRMENAPNHYKVWTEMIDKEKLDLLFVSSLPIYHFDMVKYALKKNIYIICEKPFTMNSDESKELMRLTKLHNTKVLVDFEWRYLPIRQKMKHFIKNNKIGKLLHIEYHVSSPQYEKLRLNKRGWMGQKENFGGMLGAIGTHMIDCICWLTDSEMMYVNGMVHTHVPDGAGEKRDADDAFFVHGCMSSKTTFSIQLLSGIHHESSNKLKIYGSLGTLIIENDEKLYYGSINESLTEIQFEKLLSPPKYLSMEASAYYPAFYPFLNKAYDYFVSNKIDEDLPTIHDGHKNQSIIDKVLSHNVNK